MKNDQDMSRSNLVMVCIHDKVADSYTTPYCFVNEMCAGRYYLDLVKNNDNKRFYSLIYLGSYNYIECSFNLVEPRVVIDSDSIIDLNFKVGDL